MPDEDTKIVDGKVVFKNPEQPPGADVIMSQGTPGTGEPPEKVKEPRRIYSKDELKAMSFPEKQDIAKTLGFDVLWKTEEDLDRVLSGKTRVGGIRYSRVDAMGLTQDDIEKLEKKNEQIPQDTFIPEENYDDWMKIIAKSPMAFNAVDLSDHSTETVHLLDKNKKKVQCVCGATFSIPDYDARRNPITSYQCPGVKQTVRDTKGKPRDIWVCLGNNRYRQFAVHQVPED